MLRNVYFYILEVIAKLPSAVVIARSGTTKQSSQISAAYAALNKYRAIKLAHYLTGLLRPFGSRNDGGANFLITSLIISISYSYAANAWPPKPSSKPLQVVLKTANVKEGESLKDVARRCNTTVDSLIRHNKLKPPYQIYINQPLKYEKVASSNISLTPLKPISESKRNLVQTEEKTVLSYNSLYDFERDTEALGVVLPLQKPQKSLPLRLKRTGSHFSWPLKGKVLSSFGKKKFGLVNHGINIAAQHHAPVMAAEDGVVVYAGNGIKGFGNLILLKHAENWTTAYAHNDVLLVKTGHQVKQGDVISKAGKTGHVDKVQLHFEIRKSGVPVNPTKHLK